jgi:hypothetical protein
MSEHTTQHGHGEHHAETLHEENTIQLAPVVIFAIVMILVSAATFLTVKIIEQAFDLNWARSEAPVSPLAQPQTPPAPLLQVSSGQDLRDLRAKENTLINSYHWVDQQNGVVGIPVEEAIKLLAQRGLPSRDQSNNE